MTQIKTKERKWASMYDGNVLWKPILQLEMEKKQYYGKTYDTYAGLPADLYSGMKKTAYENPGKVCIVDDDGTEITFESFLHMVDEFADYLSLEMQVKERDHVALMMFNCREFCVSFLAAVKLGAMVQPLPSKFKQHEILSLMEKSDCSLVICDLKFSGWMDPLKEKGVAVLESRGEPGVYGFSYLLEGFKKPEVHIPCAAKPEGETILMFTSGTTSRSKGVVLTNFNIMHAILTYKRILGITEKDSSIIAVPIYHVTGLIALLGLFLYSGGTVYLHRLFDAKRILECVKEKQVTFIHGSPTVFSMLLREKTAFPDLPSLRAFACGSSNMPKEKIRELHRWLPNMAFHTVYGLTETSSPATIFPCDAAESGHIGSSGMPVPGTVFRVVDETGEEVLPGQMGEIQLKGSVVLKEYYKMENPLLDREGWLSTGDMGYFSADGYIFLVDRKKDMINRGGEKICSYDVENELYLIPGVEEAAVVGIPDELYGEAAAAVVKCSPDAGLTEKKIQEILHSRIAKYKIPKKILFVDQVPETPNGKIDKKQIRTMF